MAGNKATALGAALVSLLLVAGSAPAATPGWRLASEPRDAGEAAVREAVQGPSPIGALDAVARRFPDTAAGGLARLAAALELVDAGRPADALVQLSHPDLEKIPLRDHALLAASRAQELLGKSAEAAQAALAAASEPTSAVTCTALPRAAELFARANRNDDALAALERTAAACPQAAPAALVELGSQRLARGERAAAAAAFDRLDREYPLALEAKLA